MSHSSSVSSSRHSGAKASAEDTTLAMGGDLPGSLGPRAAGGPDGLSVSELRTAMQQHLKRSGGLNTLKTQLRGMILTDLLHSKRGAVTKALRAERGGGEGKEPADLEALQSFTKSAPELPVGADGKQQNFSQWSSRLADALIENHLRRTRRAVSLSIFTTEAQPLPMTSTGSSGEEEQFLAHLLLGAAKPDGSEAEPEDGGNSRKSILQCLIEARLLPSEEGQRWRAGHVHHCGTQTEDDGATDAQNPLTSLECRLAAVDAKYALSFSALRPTGEAFFTRGEVERRLQQYKDDLHAQLREEYQRKYRAFEEKKLAEARTLAEEQYAALARHRTEELREMERSLTVRSEEERSRLQQLRAEVERQRQHLERRHKELTEETREHEEEADRLRASERALRDQLRGLQLQVEKWQDLCGTRLMEAEAARSRESRRVEEVRRLQAEHAAELTLKDEELARLRFRIRMLVQSSTQQPLSADATKNTAGGGSDGSGAMQDASRVNEQLYSMLVRTEELQRNAVAQSRLQQQRWDSSWERSAAAAAATTTTVEADANAATPSAPPVQEGKDQQAAAKRAPVVKTEEKAKVVEPPSPTSALPILAAEEPVQTKTAEKRPTSVTTATTHTTSVPSNSSSSKPKEKEKRASLSSSSPLASQTLPLHASSRASPLAPPSPLQSQPSSSASAAAPIAVATAAGTATTTATTTTAATEDNNTATSDTKSTTTITTAKEEKEAKAATGSGDSSPVPQQPSPASSASSSSSSSEPSVAKPSSGSDSSGSSTASDSATSPHKAASEKSNSSAAARDSPGSPAVDARTAAVDQLCLEEDSGRAGVTGEEDTAYRGILWSAKSQREVIESREREAERDAGGGGGRGLTSFIDQMEAQRRQREYEEVNIITRDDETDDDSILFGGKDSDESF